MHVMSKYLAKYLNEKIIVKMYRVFLNNKNIFKMTKIYLFYLFEFIILAECLKLFIFFFFFFTLSRINTHFFKIAFELILM